MPQSELLKRAAQFLEGAGIQWMLTGSLASSLQGEPRSTHDIDLVVELDGTEVPGILAEFSEERFYVSEDAIRDALANRGMFNIIDTREGDKIDFWLLTEEDYDRCRFARRQVVALEGMQIPVSSAEDTILAKLRWAILSEGSEKQFNDALRVYEVQHDLLDNAYMEEWVQRLNQGEIWERLKNQAHPIE